MAKQKASAGRRMRGLFMILLVFGPAFLLVFISTRGCEHKFKVLDDLGEIAAYSFQDIDGKTYTEKSFKNQIVLFTTIQATCPDSCAFSFWHLDQMIYQHMRTNQKKLGDVKIVSFVTDAQGNPNANLKDVQFMLNDRVQGYDPTQWILAEGEAKRIYNISRNGENLTQKGNSFQELLLLVDKKNHLRMVLKGNSEGMIRRMKEDIALLKKEYDKIAFKKRKKN